MREHRTRKLSQFIYSTRLLVFVLQSSILTTFAERGAWIAIEHAKCMTEHFERAASRKGNDPSSGKLHALDSASGRALVRDKGTNE